VVATQLETDLEDITATVAHIHKRKLIDVLTSVYFDFAVCKSRVHAWMDKHHSDASNGLNRQC
jgi:hypothetical protein